MPVIGTVQELSLQLGVWNVFSAGVAVRLGPEQAVPLIGRIGCLPVRASRATGLLGSYAHRGGEPCCIRLQMSQEPELLRTTLLHELAHACEHLAAPQPRRHRCGHGPAWREWAVAFGIVPRHSGQSAALRALRQERLKPVAVCERCGRVFYRLRRLSPRRTWLHPECGSGRVVPLPVRTGELP